jgi:hypothetical protein
MISFHCYYKNNTNYGVRFATPIQPTFEIEPRFFKSSTNEIFFSGHSSGNYTIYGIADIGHPILRKTKSDIFFPFEFDKKICGLTDQDGDEQFKTTNATLNKLLNYKSVKSIFSFKEGGLIFVKLNNDDNIYEIKNHNSNKIPGLNNVKHLETVLYYKKSGCIIVSYDNKLVMVSLNLNTAPVTLLDDSDNVEEIKFNPFISNDDLYFSDNENSELYQIFKIDLKSPSLKKEFVYKTDHDIRMPKIKNNDLYFLEIVDSQYLLKRFNLKSKNLSSITSKGVVYYYDFYKANNLIYSYSDFYLPKCLMVYNEINNTETNMTGKSIILKVSIKSFKPHSNISRAYVIKPNQKNTPKGVILFFHPGLHSDFSPRWEPVLVNLSLAGYIIIAPNYPMSCGYGKSFYSADLKLAITDISLWKDYIKHNYPKLSLYYLSSSSGNVLMEESLSADNKDVIASCSMFGIPAVDIPDFSLPSLYILGKNDPILNFPDRIKNLQIARKANHKISFISYNNEGHWIRNSVNLDNTIKAIENEFANNPISSY